MATIVRKRTSKQKQFGSIRQLVSDGLDLFALGNGVREVEPDTTIYLNQSRFGIKHSQSKQLIEHEFDVSKPHETAALIRGYIKPKTRVLFVLDRTCYFGVMDHSESASNRICADTAARTAQMNSPFHRKNTVYFWRRDDNYRKKCDIHVFILSSDILEGFYAGLRDVNANVIGMITSKDFMAERQFSAINSMQKTNIKHEQNWKSELKKLEMLPRTYSILFFACFIFIASAIASFSVSSQKTAGLTGASSQARSDLETFATAGIIKNKLKKMRRDAFNKLRLMNAVASKMEDGSWVNRIRINDGAVEVSGISKSAADTLRQIAEVKGTSNVRLLSSVTRDSKTQLERFIIGLDQI